MPAVPTAANLLDELKAPALSLCALIMMAVDAINPVKVLCFHTGISTSTVALVLLCTLAMLLMQHASNVLYGGARIFLKSIMGTFFRRVEVIGAENIPETGPVVFASNHSNQFVDALALYVHGKRKIGFLIAKKSWHRPVIGHFARAMGCIPVERPQDAARKGTGTISVSAMEETVRGAGTQFLSQVRPGDSVRLAGTAAALRVKDVASDEELTLATVLSETAEGAAFDVLPKVDQSAVYGTVHSALARGNCVGIFPEGGSHDRTTLLPLKAGISVMAFGTKDKHGISPKVVPVGLSYHRGHRFRGNLMVTFGPPVEITPGMWAKYKAGQRREAYTELLERVEDGMRAVLVSTTDYATLRLIYLARRLYQRDGERLPPAKRQDLNRRFAEGYRLLTTGGDESTEMAQLRERLEQYRLALKNAGIRDNQVDTMLFNDLNSLVWSFVHLLGSFLISSIPTLILNAPVGLLARVLAKKEQKKALAGSRVKIAAYDVVLSKKVLITLVGVPLLWMFYAVLLAVFTDLPLNTIAVLIGCCPVFAYVGVVATEAGVSDAKDLKPYLLRLVRRKQLDELPRMRAQLQCELRDFIRKVGPSLGPVYTDKSVDWTRVMRSASTDNVAGLAGGRRGSGDAQAETKRE